MNELSKRQQAILALFQERYRQNQPPPTYRVKTLTRRCEILREQLEEARGNKNGC